MSEIKLKYFLTAQDARFTQDTQLLDVRGSFDSVFQPIFPFVFEKFVMIFGFEGLEENTMFELRINDPDEELVSKNRVGVGKNLIGLTSHKIIAMDKMPIQKQGTYTVDILQVVGDDKYKFISTMSLFKASYPLQREFKEGEKEEIINSPENIIKTMKTKIKIPGTEVTFKLQLNLDPKIEIEDGFIPFPEDDELVYEDKKLSLVGVRRQLEWMFGQDKNNFKNDKTVN